MGRHRAFLTQSDRTSTSQNLPTHQNWNSRRLVPGVAFGVKCAWAVRILRVKTVHMSNGKTQVFYKNRPFLIEYAIRQFLSLNHQILREDIQIIEVAVVCLPHEIDASRFSGPDQLFAGAPYISVQKSNAVFSMPNRSMPMPRSIAVLENDRKRSKKS